MQSFFWEETEFFVLVLAFFPSQRSVGSGALPLGSGLLGGVLGLFHVRPSVRPSVRASVRPSVRENHEICVSGVNFNRFDSDFHRSMGNLVVNPSKCITNPTKCK